MKTTNLIALAALTFLFTAGAKAITIDMVTVGNPGNAPDTEIMSTDGTAGYGSVGYSYQIGKYEVTAGQYTAFLNAVAKDDLNGLYNSTEDDLLGFGGSKIQRSGSPGNYSYNVAPDWANRPVNFVSFWDAARFANWLHNGQPTGPQSPGTTEGGAYLNIGNQDTFVRQPGARFFIPTENEWYKAAYHDSTSGLAANYFDFATGTNIAPGHDFTELTNPGNNANAHFAIGEPYYRTEVGEFELSESTYGTFDQAGNVWEWNETTLFTSWRGVRGGALNLEPYTLAAHIRIYNDPAYEGSGIGFRVASIIPEPASICLLILSGLAIWPCTRVRV